MKYILKLFDSTLEKLDSSKRLITTLNAHSYNTLQEDKVFSEALKSSDILLPDGVSMVWASRVLLGKKIKKIAGDDLFYFEMNRVQNKGGSCFFLGSTFETLKIIKERAKIEFPDVKVHYYSPPYKAEFSEKDSATMINAVNRVKPDTLFIGLTAPKQEKWAYQHFDKLEAEHICCIGAVFDFYAGTVNRAPKWMISIGMEWFYRLVKEPRRMWRRYVIGNPLFVKNIISKKISLIRDNQYDIDLVESSDVLQD